VEPPPTRRSDPNFGFDTFTFDGAAAFTLPVRLTPGTPAGSNTLPVEVEFQVCSDSLCLPPKTVELKLDVKVGGGVE